MPGYKVGDKFVIEIKEIDNLKNHMVLEDIAVGTDMLDKLERLDSDYVNEHYGELQDEAYNKGLEDAWKLAKKIVVNTDNGGMSLSEIQNVFNYSSSHTVLRIFTPQEALAKLEAYEKEQEEIKVGDVVTDLNNVTKGVVLAKDEKRCLILFGDGSSDRHEIKNMIKTGKHIDIQSMLQQIGGAE